MFLKSLTIIFAGAKAGIGTTHIALGFSNFLTRNGCPTLYQEEYDSEAGRTLVHNLRARSDASGVYQKGCLYIRPYYGSSMRIPYRYFPIITKDIGTGWQEKTDLPEGDYFVLICGGKWWETDTVLRAVKQLKREKNLILLWNHVSGGVIPKLPEEVHQVECLSMPFFANPLKADRDADACYRVLYKTITGGCDGWERKKRRGFWSKRQD